LINEEKEEEEEEKEEEEEEEEEEISKGLPLWQGTPISAKIGLHVKISSGFLDYVRVLASERMQAIIRLFGTFIKTKVVFTQK
jgi:hypothetical protein